MNQRYPSDLTDSQWHLIKGLLPPPKRRGRPPLNLREVINAVCYVLKGGIQWRMMPSDCPKWQSVYGYFRRWRRDGTWRRIHDTLRAATRRRAGRHKHPTAGCLDSQSARTTETAAAETRGCDWHKRVKGRKRHLLVDTLGLLLAVAVTAANVQDKVGALLVLSGRGGAGKKLRRVWADGAYRTERGHLAAWLERHRINHAARCPRSVRTSGCVAGASPHQPDGGHAARRAARLPSAAAPLGGRAHLRVAVAVAPLE